MQQPEVRLYHIGVYLNRGADIDPIRLTSVTSNAIPRLLRKTMTSLLHFGTVVIAQRICSGLARCVTNDQPVPHQAMVYCRPEDNVSVVVVCSPSYPEQAAWSVLHRVFAGLDRDMPHRPDLVAPRAAVQDYTPQWLEELIDTCQDPAKASTMIKIQEDLADTKDNLHVAIESLMQRGESLDSLADRSKELDDNAKRWLGRIRKHNRRYMSCWELAKVSVAETYGTALAHWTEFWSTSAPAQRVVQPGPEAAAAEAAAGPQPIVDAGVDMSLTPGLAVKMAAQDKTRTAVSQHPNRFEEHIK